MVKMIAHLSSIVAYFVSSKTVHRIGNPFVKDWIESVLDTNHVYYAYPTIEHERKMLLQNTSFITFEDHGSGNRSGQRTIKDIATTSLSSVHQCRMLFQMVNRYKPKTLLELGTSLGLSTLYMAYAKFSTAIYTIEGNPASNKLAQILFERHQKSNIKAISGTFLETLEQVNKEAKHWDMVFIDGHHDGPATLTYFKTIQPFLHENSMVVFDDIHWSQGMNKAWKTLCSEATISIDAYEIGVLFFRRDIQPGHYTVIDEKYKPWEKTIFAKNN